MSNKWLCCTRTSGDPAKKDPALSQPGQPHGYSSFCITQDLAASDASMYSTQGLMPGQLSQDKRNQVKHAGNPHNPYRRSRDTTWDPDIATCALFPPSSQTTSSQQHPSLHSQKLHSGASTQSALQTGASTTMTKALQSGRSTAQRDNSNARSSSKLRSSSVLRSGESKPHSGLNSALLRSMQDVGYSQAGATAPPAALHSGHSTIYPMLHTSHQTPALHSGHSVSRPELDPSQLQHPGTLQDQYVINNPLFGDDSCLHDSPPQHQGLNDASQQKPTSALHTSDSHGQAVLSSSTPDRQDLPCTGRQSSPSCDSVQDGAGARAERGHAFSPVPTAPPSTVSRNGRIVERAAKGIYLTLERQADGRHKLLRIRFNRNVYSKKEAEVWWNQSRHGLAKAHNLAPGGPVPNEQPGRVFVGEGGGSAPPHRPGSINLEYHISSVITDVADGRNEAPVEVVKQAELLRKGLRYAQSAIYCQHNCQQLMLCACHAVHALLLSSNQSAAKAKVTKKLAELLSEAVETVAVFSEPGWLLRLEGHVEDVPQMRKLHAELAQLTGIAGAAGVQTLPGIAGAQGNRSFRGEYSQPDSAAGIADVQDEEVLTPDWRDDSDVLRGRLLELGGVAGLQTDTDCLLLKDLCRSGLEDVAFLELVDLELQEHQANEVRGAHEVIRHTSMRLFWVRAAGPREELPWARFWKSFPSTLHGADTNALMRETVTVIDNRRMFQGAVSGAAGDHTTAVEIDKAFPPGFSIPDSFQRLLEVARRQKVRSNSSLSQRDLLNSGIDIMETDGELYSEQKQLASRRSAEAQLFAAGFWRCEQDALLTSFDDTICRLEDRLSQTSRDVYSTLQSAISVGGQGRSGVALRQSKGSDTGLLAFGLARQMIEAGRWSQVAYAEMAGISNEAEAAARMSAAVGLPSYPIALDETLRICSWLKGRSASAGFLGLVVDACNTFQRPQDVNCIVKLLSTILADTANLQIVVMLPEACSLSRSQWIVDAPPQMPRAIEIALLQSNLGHMHAPAVQLEAVIDACCQHPCLIHIAGRALAQGCLSLQVLLSNSPGLQKRMSSSSHFQRSMQSGCGPEEAGALPKWLLQMLSQEEREGLLRLSVFPLAITMDMASCVLPSTLEQSQVQSVMHQLHRLGILKHNPAHRTYQVDPYLGPHLAALARQQPSALYSPSLLGWSQACLQTCATATALYSAHAQVSGLWMVDRSRGQVDGLLNALAQDLPAKALPVVVDIISNHMEVLNFRLSAKQKQQVCTHIGRAAEEAGDILGEVQCAVQLAEQGCMERPHALQGLAGSMHLVERALGADHPLAAHILLHQARLLRQQHQHHQANEALQACLTIQEAALGLDHPEVADTLQELATTLEAQGLKHQAEPVLRQCLAIRSHALGMQHPDTAAVLHALACLLSGDRLADAEVMLGQAWRTMKQSLGNVHPKLAQVLADLATLKARQKKITEAQQLLRRSVAVWRHMEAGSHPALLNALRMLSNLCLDQGAGGQEEEQRLRQECSCIEQLMATTLGTEKHLEACAHLSSLQVIASLPRGATRRLYTAPHSLLDTFPTQLPRQLLDTAANDSPATAAMASSASGSKYQQAPHAGVVSNQTRCSDVNVLLERARISPVSSTASIQSSDSNNVVDSQRMAAATPHFGAKTSGIMTPGVSERRPVSGFPALDYAHPHGDDHPHDPVSGECNSRNQFPASPAAAMTTSRATRQLAGAQPRAGSRSEPQQQMGASHETSLATQSQHINQPRQHCSSSAQVKLPPSSEPTQRQDWHLEESHPQLSRHNLQGSAVMPSGHPASQLSTEPILASSIGAPLPVLEHRPQLEALAQDRPNLNQSTPGVVPHLSNTPVLSVNQSEGLATAGVESAASGGLWPSLATAGHQHSFSVVPVDSADDAPEAELSQRQQALRSLSSKGVQTSRTVSGKGDRTPRDGSSETTGKLSLGPASQGQPQMTTPMRSEAYFKAGYTKDVDGEGIRQPVAQKTGTVRALASQLNFRSDSSKHLN